MQKHILSALGFGLLTLTVGCDLFSLKPLVPYDPPAQDDTGPSTETTDTGATDTGPTDTGPTDTSVTDTETTDTAITDTAITDTAPPDNDGDGYDASVDCDDSDADINPGAAESCDPDDIDEDCDGFSDDSDPEGADGQSLYYVDDDGDTYGDAADKGTLFCDEPDSGYSVDNTDCNDVAISGGADIYPGVTEGCDGVDNDCDAAIDEDAFDASTYYADDDSDGYGDPADAQDACSAPPGYVADSSDCDDDNVYTFPGSAEFNSADCMTDADGDGWGDDDPAIGVTSGDDCDDSDDHTHPGAAPIEGLDCMTDADEDDYGDATPGTGVTPGADCDDSVLTGAAINPEAAEVCDSVDNDCDVAIDEAWYETDFSAGADTGVLTLNGDASDAFGGLQLLNDGITNEASSVFFSQLYPGGSPWVARFTVNIQRNSDALTGSVSGVGDGMAFVVLDETDPTGLADGGGYLGVGGDFSNGLTGYAFELDIYDNNVEGSGERGDPGLCGGEAYPHCGVSEVAPSPSEPFTYIDDLACDFLDSGAVEVEITFDGGAYTMALDGVEQLDSSIPGYALGDVMLGFTAGSGGASADIVIDDLSIGCETTPADTPDTPNSVSDASCVDVDLGDLEGIGVDIGSSAGGSDTFTGDCATATGGPDVVYLWEAPYTGWHSFDSSVADYDTLLYVMDDCSGAQLICNDDRSSGDYTSIVGLYLQAGEEVIIVLDSYDAFGGNYELDINACED